MKSRTRDFSLADILIAVLIAAFTLCVSTFFIYRSSLDVSASNNTSDITYTVIFRSVSDDIAASFEVGDKVIDSVKNSQIGILAAYEIRPSLSEINNGESVTVVENQGIHDILLTVNASAERGDHIDIGDTRIAVGKTLYIRTRHFSGVGICSSIDVGGNEYE